MFIHTEITHIHRQLCQCNNNKINTGLSSEPSSSNWVWLGRLQTHWSVVCKLKKDGSNSKTVTVLFHLFYPYCNSLVFGFHFLAIWLKILWQEFVAHQPFPVFSFNEYKALIVIFVLYLNKVFIHTKQIKHVQAPCFLKLNKLNQE